LRDSASGHELESGDPVAERPLQGRKKANGRRHVRHRCERRPSRSRRGVQLEHGGGDDAERSFRADEEVLHVVTRVVLAQAAKAIPDPAIRKHDLDAENEIARVAEAQDGVAARVGREIAADRAAAFCSERQREHESLVCGGLLDERERHTGLHGQRRIGGIDGTHAVHS
jgi:hypothetical protein